MITIAVQLFEDATEANLLADWTGRLRRGQVETDEHGFASCSGFVPMTLDESFFWYDAAPVKHLVVSAGGFRLFEGRIEDRAITDGGLEFAAFGYWRALSDLLYTAMWSTKNYGDWRPVTDNDTSGRTPEKYVMDNNNRLYVGLRKNEAYGSGGYRGSWFYERPHNSSRTDALRIGLSYDVTLPTDWVLQVRSWDTGFSGDTFEETIVTGNGSQQTGTFSRTLTSGKEIIELVTVNASGSTTTVTAETGAWYSKATSVRVKSTTQATVSANFIVNDIIGFVSGINSGQLSSSTELVESPGVDLTDEQWFDARASDIIMDLARRGESNNDAWEAGVWEGQKLHFRPRGSQGLTWYADIENLNLNSTLDTMYNSAYAVYRDERGVTRRTSISNDADRQSIYGLVRRTAPVTNTSSSTVAENTRNMALAQLAYTTPTARIGLRGLFTAGGGMAEPWLARAGDTVIIRNLPPTAGEEIDRIRTFIISRTTLDLDTGEMTLAPEIDPPGLEFAVAALQDSMGDMGLPNPPAGPWGWLLPTPGPR